MILCKIWLELINSLRSSSLWLIFNITLNGVFNVLSSLKFIACLILALHRFYYFMGSVGVMDSFLFLLTFRFIPAPLRMRITSLNVFILKTEFAIRFTRLVSLQRFNLLFIHFLVFLINSTISLEWKQFFISFFNRKLILGWCSYEGLNIWEACLTFLTH